MYVNVRQNLESIVSIYPLFYSSEATPYILMSIHPSVCPTVGPSGLGGNVIFSAPDSDRGLIFSSFATYGCHPCYFLNSDSYED